LEKSGLFATLILEDESIGNSIKKLSTVNLRMTERVIELSLNITKYQFFLIFLLEVTSFLLLDEDCSRRHMSCWVLSYE